MSTNMHQLENSALSVHLTFLSLSVLSFYLLSSAITRYVTPLHVGIRRKEWKWRNISVSLVHSSITGFGSLLAFYLKPELTEDLIVPSSILAQRLVAVSAGYFIYDAADMLKNNPGIRCYELLIHHLTVLTCFIVAMVTNQYFGWAMAGLVMEMNSIFLHIRQLLKVSNTVNKYSNAYRINSIVNLATFIGFRILPSGYMTRWLIQNRDRVSLPLYSVGLLGMATLVVMNMVLFCRLIYGDFMKNRSNK